MKASTKKRQPNNIEKDVRHFSQTFWCREKTCCRTTCHVTMETKSGNYNVQ